MMVPVSGKKPKFDPVIFTIIDPVIQMCEKAAEAHKSKGSHLSRRRTSSDMGQNSRDTSPIDALLAKSSSVFTQSSETPAKIFLINCLSAIQQPLIGHDVAAKFADNLGSMIESHISILVNREVDAILRRCGLLNKISWFKKSKDTEHAGVVKPLAEMEEMTPHLLSESLRSFFGIVTGTEGSLPEFEQMQVPKLRSDACLRVARELAESYELIYYAVVDPKNQYPEPRSLLRHTPYQIRTILAI